MAKAFKGVRGREAPIRVLCHFNHYFGRSSPFAGKSTSDRSDQRREVVDRALRALATLPFDVTIRVCGIPGQSLVPITDRVPTDDPLLIIYASLEMMAARRDDGFTHFLAIEDDVEVNPAFVRNAIEFARTSEVNEVWLPNRIEHTADGQPFCVDYWADPGWRGLDRTHAGIRLDVAKNPHSGLVFLSREQVDYAVARVDLARRERFLGHFMESAFANLHMPFLLWRARDALLAHHVAHLDRWEGPQEANAPDASRLPVAGSASRL